MSKHVFAPVVLALLSAAAGAQQPQTPPAPAPRPTPSPEARPTFPAQVEQVTVDAVVTDKKGNPIKGLTKGDFVVSEDGAPQAISTFESIELPAAPSAAPPPRPRVSTNTSPEARTGRTFVIAFDDIHLTPFQAHRAKGAVAEFLTNGVREGDRVTLVATGGAAWWSTRMMAGRDELIKMVKRLDGRNIPDTSPERMTDYEALRIHIYRDPTVIERVRRRYDSYGVNPSGRQSQSSNPAQTLEDPMVSSKASEVYYQATTRMRITLEVIERVLDSLVASKGRKSLVLVSQGFIYDPNLDEFKKVVQASRRANTAIYCLDTRGLDAMPMAMTAQFGPPIDSRDIGSLFSENIEASEGSESIAADSGGFTVKNQNDLGKGIQRIADESRAYYMLGYSPTNTARDGKFRKIEVKVVGQKGLQVRARKGYYAPLEGGRSALDRKPRTTDPDIQAALDSPFEVEEIPLRMSAYVFDETLLGKAAVVVATEVDVRNVAFEEKEGRFLDTLEFLLVVAHRESGEFFRYDQKVEMKLLLATREKMSWYLIGRDFELKPGGYQAKIVVRDKNAGKLGTVIHEFEVPPLSSFRISTPVLSVQPKKEGDTAPPRPALVVSRDFKGGASSTLYCQVEVYGAAKDKKSGMPHVTMGYTILRPDGSPLARRDPTLIRPTSLGKLSRLFGEPLEWATPGDYELVLSLKDEIADKALEVREPFKIVSGPPAASGGS